MDPAVRERSFACRRLGVVFAPDGSPQEVEGVLNPGLARDRAGRLLLFPRVVAAGNFSRIAIARARGAADPPDFERLGFALEPQAEYELRAVPGGQGCEDARVTFLPGLDRYVMAYTAFGPRGARIALAVSSDAYAWTRLGLVRFADDALNLVDNKDAAFFPEVVNSPAGVRSFAFFHRPMHPGSVNGQTPIPTILAMPPERREAACIAYVPAADVADDVAALCRPRESVRMLPVEGGAWGRLKNGAGTPPLRTPLGWLSVFHGVDAVETPDGPALFYSAGILINALAAPHVVAYRSPEPILVPETRAERFGTVNDVVFPTGLDVLSETAFDVYYGAADAKISRARLEIASLAVSAL